MEPKKPGELDERMIAMLQSEGGRSTITYDDDEEDLPDQGRTTITYDDEEQEQFQQPEESQPDLDQQQEIQHPEYTEPVHEETEQAYEEQPDHLHQHPALLITQEDLDAACNAEHERPSDDEISEYEAYQ